MNKKIIDIVFSVFIVILLILLWLLNPNFFTNIIASLLATFIYSYLIYIKPRKELLLDRRKYPLYVVLFIFITIAMVLVFLNYPSSNAGLCVDILFYYESSDGKIYPLLEGSELNSGDGYAICVKPNMACYFYVYQIDIRKNVFRLFPNKEYNTGINPLPAEQNWFPNLDQLYVLDKNKGKEQILVFASTKKIYELNQDVSKKGIDYVSNTMGVAEVKRKKNRTRIYNTDYYFNSIELNKIKDDRNSFKYEFWFDHN